MIAAVEEAIAVASHQFWPWVERPYTLIGLFDMLRFYAATFVNVTMAIERALGLLAMEDVVGGAGLPPIGGRVELRQALVGVQTEMKRLPLSRSFQHQLKRAIESVEGDTAYSFFLPVVREILANLQHELTEWFFFAVPPDRRPFYDSPERWFGQEIFDAYQDSEADLKEAGRCFALSLWTACVFHLMRAVESALHKWADQLGVILKMPVTEANWQDIISAGTESLKKLEQQPKSQQRSNDLEYFGESQAQFSSFKNAWRNHVAHGKQTYDERRASEIMESVRAFMRKLATRP